ncbi:hypothetical protein B0H11DRAFT_2242125 [Mycena galericulata]|nr:hypothetical protein B0H11DRAFT_2242125 [Mycena galericulata]
MRTFHGIHWRLLVALEQGPCRHPEQQSPVEVVENSSEYGTFNGDPPEKVDIVLAANTESSQPPQYRKSAVNLKLPVPKAIALENFPSPASARGKKSAEATRKVVEKPSKWKSPTESKQNGKAEAKVPVPHGAYGTRGTKKTT